MQRCDFSSVIGVIRQYFNEGSTPSQPEMIYDLFYSFAEKNEDFDFDNGQINRWIKGLAPVSPRIAEFYQHKSAAEGLAADLQNGIFPIMYDEAMAVRDLYNLLMNDIGISEQKKTEISTTYPDDNGAFVAAVLVFAINRKFEKHDEKLLTTGTLSPITDDVIFDGAVPKPCKYFCGRDNELSELHNILELHSKVFVNGIAGIGKSELAKAYAAAYKKSYTNILYFTYSGSLQDMIADMDFADDMPSDDSKMRFKKHNRFLRSLKDDTLIIIDNFNTTASKEPTLDVVMKNNCRVIFTTRSRFEIGHTFELTEIADMETLLSLSGKFYSDTDNEREAVTGIIETVHKHTLSVELSARLLQKGMLEPNEVLKKLSECTVNPETTDKISINKDGINSKATYYNHIQTLFSLYLLDNEMQNVMRCMAFIPIDGVRAKLFARWLGLSDMNAVNDLVELGFIQNNTADKISLHPMVQEIAVADLKPSVTNCREFIGNLHFLCLRHGDDVPYYETLFRTIESITEVVINDSSTDYLLFIEDAFAYMEKYRYASGMHRLVDVMSALLADETVGNANDRALLFNNKASCEGLLNMNYPKAITLAKKAISVCIPEDNIVLAANLHMNLGYLYQYSKDFDNAKLYMKQGMDLLSQSGILTNDMIFMARNYARLLAETGEANNAIKALKNCAAFVKSQNTDMCTDYVDLVFDIAAISLQIGNTDTAKAYFDEAFMIYRKILPQADLSEKAELAAEYLKRVGIATTPDFLALK